MAFVEKLLGSYFSSSLYVQFHKFTILLPFADFKSDSNFVITGEESNGRKSTHGHGKLMLQELFLCIITKLFRYFI